MDIRSFGEALIETGDLDPVYYVRHAGISEPQLCRLLLAYWCFYHLGVAAWMSEWEGQDYWDKMEMAAVNDPAVPPSLDELPGSRWPRASERRHFRGPKCVAAVEWLRSEGDRPESWVRRISTLGTDQAIMNYVQTWPMFGPWIAFKAADMMERVYGAAVTFDRDIGLMYDSPRHGLNRLAGTAASQRTVYDQLLRHFEGWGAPPSMGRPCGPQEVETILCKWDSHMEGGYTVGKDITEVRHALAGWGETADRITAVMPEEVA